MSCRSGWFVTTIRPPGCSRIPRAASPVVFFLMVATANAGRVSVWADAVAAAGARGNRSGQERGEKACHARELRAAVRRFTVASWP